MEHARQAGLFAVAFALLALPLSGGSLEPTPVARVTAAPGELLVAYRPGHSFTSLSRSAASEVRQSRALGVSRDGIRFERVGVRPGARMEQTLAAMRADASVLVAAPNYYLRHLQVFPSDAQFAAGSMWGLHNTGQTLAGASYPLNNPGSADADVDAPEAWATNTGAASVLVAVIDSGVDYTHPDLAAALWDASNARFNGNPLPSGLHGYDFADDDADPYPVPDDHGTHVAGTIAAIANNGIGIPGIAHGVTIAALKIESDHGIATEADFIQALNYAAENGVQVVNVSLGRDGPENPVVTRAMADAIARGVLIVAAAGNGNTDNDIVPMWPANYAAHEATRDGVISVAATDQRDQKASFSSFGATTVTVGAPGVNIMSAVVGRELRQAENARGVPPGTLTHCSDPAQEASCLDRTVFDRGPGVSDCIAGAEGTVCRWGVFRSPIDPSVSLFAADTDAETGYANDIDGTIQTQPINTVGSRRSVLRYSAVWDMECGNDFLDVEVWNGGTRLATLRAPEFNFNNARNGPCESGHTHTGRFPGMVAIAHDISAHAASAAALSIRFRFVSDGDNDDLTEPQVGNGFRLWDIRIDVQASDYTNAYRFMNGTSMASPLVAGIAALVKSRNPSYTPAQLKQAVVNGADVVPTLAGIVSSGGRANAHGALTLRPEIRALTPAGAAPGASGLTLGVEGAKFITGAVVRWNGAPRATTFESATRLAAVVPAADLAQPGSANVDVVNPDGSVSNAVLFTIDAAATGPTPPPTQSMTSSSGGGGGGCFIATAAFGSPLAGELAHLRAFRDRYLLSSAWGRRFVQAYYRYSPPLADWLARHDLLRALVRFELRALIAVGRLFLDLEPTAPEPGEGSR